MGRAKPEFLELTSLRAFAALHVVLFHNLYLLGDSARALPAWVHTLVSTGFVSVSFFFLLSGFVLAYAYGDTGPEKPLDRGAFWKARVARIYPIYLLSFLLDAPRAVGYFLDHHPPLLGALKSMVAGAAYLGLVQAWLPQLASAWNAPGWSLSNEAFFYLLYPLLAERVGRLRARWLVPMLAACTGASLLLTAPFVWGIDAAASGFWMGLAGFNPLMRLPEFLAGIVLGRMYLLRHSQSLPVPPALRLLAPAGAAGLLGVLLVSPRIPPLLLHNGLLLPLFAMIVYGLALRQTPGQHWLRHPVLVLLGRSSFGLYILHQPIKSYVVQAGSALGVTPGPLLFSCYLGVAVLFSLAAFHWVEEPARQWLRAVLRRRRRQADGLMAEA
ncbi:acyltransferase [Archangium violaceum]|uniref:acyltransferase family protein n=1 Tax=Archangium violaceum TaxID=83451 RepID=UPI00195052D4|nr:acyltransferase [Archangium violaceum]QRO01491.1 acyltransferase [Archangium violaceum]